MTDYDIEKVKLILREKLDDYRYNHSLGVASAAKKLAERYGENPEKAYFAGLLHDITKNTPKPEQLKIIEKGKVSLTEDELRNPKLWHAISGSVYIRDELNVTDEDIIGAVRYHTTGKDNMTLLEKIIYISDFISEERDFDGVDYMRELAFESLDKAAMFALEFCIPDLVKKGQILHIDSVRLYNELAQKHIKSMLMREEEE